jgi:predicted ester cyclase
MGDLERNKAVTRAFYADVWSEHRLERIDEIATPDVVLHVWGNERRGRDEMHRGIEEVWVAAFPDLSADIHLQVAEGDLVADHVTFAGTHSGSPFHGIEPTGASFSFTQTTICRIEDGRIAEIWEDFDWRGLLRAIGAE